jgi:hypothetical protein
MRQARRLRVAGALDSQLGAETLRIAGVTTVERAYQLAESGQYQSIPEITKRLRVEGFIDATEHVSASRALALSLSRVIEARPSST